MRAYDWGLPLSFHSCSRSAIFRKSRCGSVASLGEGEFRRAAERDRQMQAVLRTSMRDFVKAVYLASRP